MIKIDRPICPNPTALTRVDGWNDRTNKSALAGACFNKCMYCESFITHIDYGDIEHIKPKSLFPELACDWNNLGYSCPRCNREYKKDKFDSNTPFLNPYEDNPKGHIFALGALIKHRQGSERGEITIDEELGIGLNRNDLLEKRLEKIKFIGKTVDQCFRTQNQQLKENALEELKKEAGNDKEYSLCIEHLLKMHGIL